MLDLPLTALRTFAAVGQALSYSQAAKKLGVTQTAVSHQMKALEKYLGIKLVQRRGRYIELTASGSTYWDVVNKALRDISEKTEKIRGNPSAKVLKVTSTYSFASKWLLPHISDWQQKHPDIEIMLKTNDNLDDLVNDDLDVGIRCGNGQWLDLIVKKIADLELVLVACPELLTKHSIDKIDDLKKIPLLQNEGETDWKRWFKNAGIDDSEYQLGTTFSNNALLIQAVIDGLGVAICPKILVKEDIKRGLIVSPFSLKMLEPLAYYLVYAPRVKNLAKVNAFTDWILGFDNINKKTPV